MSSAINSAVSNRSSRSLARAIRHTFSISDETSGLIGGLGLAAGANIGNHAAIFEAVHGSAPDIAGLGIANPSAVVLAGCMLFEYMGRPEVGSRTREALVAALQGGVRTRDLGGTASTREFADSVMEELD